MPDDPTRLPCPECLTGEAHTDPFEPHVHATPYGYLLYSPEHPRPGFLEEFRSLAHQGAAREIVAMLARLIAAVDERVSDPKVRACQRVGLHVAKLKVIEMADRWATAGGYAVSDG